MQWTEEAKEAVSKVPFFVRKKVRAKVEEEAKRQGARVVTMEHVMASKRRFLNRMEDEVKGYQVETCFGPSGCPNRAVKVDGLSPSVEKFLAGKDLKGFLKERVSGPLKFHHEFRVSISDCPNACSRPQIVDVGLIGASVPEVTDEECTQCEACVEACKEGAVKLEGGHPVILPKSCLYCGACISACPTGTLKEKEAGYRILVGGKLGRHPRLGQELPGIFPPHTVLELIEKIVSYYMAHSEGGERLGTLLEKRDMEEFLKEIGKK